jgi:hypothetical protein
LRPALPNSSPRRKKSDSPIGNSKGTAKAESSFHAAAP